MQTEFPNDFDPPAQDAFSPDHKDLKAPLWDASRLMLASSANFASASLAAGTPDRIPPAFMAGRLYGFMVRGFTRAHPEGPITFPGLEY